MDTRHICLINPPNWGQPVYELPLGLAYIASSLRSEGYDVVVVDMPIEGLTIEQAIRRIEEIAPDFIGITTLSINIGFALELARGLKQADFQHIIFGGIHATYHYQEILQTEYVDYVVLYEGEETILDLISAIEKGTPLADVRGIAYRVDGQCLVTQKRPLSNLDSIPLPAVDLFPIQKYIDWKNIAPCMTTRGCAYRCIFCSIPNFWHGKIRQRCLELVKKEIQLYKSYGFEKITFRDDFFTYNRQKIIELANFLKTENLSWGCETRLNAIDKSLLNIMVSSGLTEIRLGVETIHSKSLKLLKKGGTVSDIHQAIELLKYLPIAEKKLSFIIGIPGENEDDVRQTIDFAASLLDYDFISRFWVLMVPVEAELYQRKEEFGIRLLDRPWNEITPFATGIETEHLSAEKLSSLLKEAHEKVHSPFAGRELIEPGHDD